MHVHPFAMRQHLVPDACSFPSALSIPFRSSSPSRASASSPTETHAPMRAHRFLVCVIAYVPTCAHLVDDVRSAVSMDVFFAAHVRHWDPRFTKGAGRLKSSTRQQNAAGQPGYRGGFQTLESGAGARCPGGILRHTSRSSAHVGINPLGYGKIW